MSTDEAHFDLVVIGNGSNDPKTIDKDPGTRMRVALIERQSETGETTVYAGTITSRTVREAAATLAAKEDPNLLKVNTANQNEIAELMLQIESALTGQSTGPVVGDLHSDEVDPAIAAVWRDSIEAEFDTLKAG